VDGRIKFKNLKSGSMLDIKKAAFVRGGFSV